mgnify:FL=1
MSKQSTGLRNYMMGTGSFKAAMDGGFIKIYAGTVPSSANDSLGSATLLCTISNNSTATGLTVEAVPVGGVITKTISEVWSGANVASGTASFYRFVTAADDGTLSTTQRRWQGTVAVAGSDMNISDTALVAAAPQLIDYATFALPSE